jgi:hypothetical protein
VHADLRDERMLQALLSDRFWPLDLYASAQQTRLPVHLVTRERTVATPDTKIHIHDEHVCAVNNSGRDLFFCCFECVQIGKRFDREWQRTAEV